MRKFGSGCHQCCPVCQASDTSSAAPAPFRQESRAKIANGDCFPHSHPALAPYKEGRVKNSPSLSWPINSAPSEPQGRDISPREICSAAAFKRVAAWHQFRSPAEQNVFLILLRRPCQCFHSAEAAGQVLKPKSCLCRWCLAP